MVVALKFFKRIAVFVVLVFVVSCKSTKTIASGNADASLTTKRIISNHYQNEIDFETLSGKIKIDYDDGENKQGIGVSFRMKKDETIWISAPFGVVKAIVTPERVSFYNKLENEYFDGDFSYLSNLLGTELDFYKVQNLLLGNAVLNLRDEKYNSLITDGNYTLEPKKANELFKILFSLEPKNFRIAKQELSQPWKNRFLKMEYQYQNLESKVLPEAIVIDAMNNTDRTLIDLEYKGMEFGRALNFPYKIPNGFKEIVLE